MVSKKKRSGKRKPVTQKPGPCRACKKIIPAGAEAVLLLGERCCVDCAGGIDTAAFRADVYAAAKRVGYKPYTRDVRR